jgi:hypothetical protein
MTLAIHPATGPEGRETAGYLAKELQDRFGVRLRLNSGNHATGLQLDLSGPQNHGSEAYQLSAKGGKVLISGASILGVKRGIQTLLQLCGKEGGEVSLRAVEIEDWPSLRWRGLLEDVSSAADMGVAKVPTFKTLKELVSQLASWKFNVLQLYVENTFHFKKHPLIGKGYGRMEAEEVRSLDRYCRTLGIDLIPNLASFSHMEKILSLPEYRHLSVGPPYRLLNPLQEGSYRLLDELYGEFLPCFSSPYFNINCDETFDLGIGRSKAAVKKWGKAEVYLRHILRLHELVTGKYGRRMLMWGDIVQNHPELIPRLPKDIIVLPWGYYSRWEKRDMAPFRKAGLDFLVCPSSNTGHSPSPWVHVFNQNIQSAALQSGKNGGLGIMNTDWGDGGHAHPLGWSFYGFAMAGEQAWSGGTTPEPFFDRQFSLNVFGDAKGTAAKLWRVLGLANEALGIKPVYQYWWYSVNFALLYYEFDLGDQKNVRQTPAGVVHGNLFTKVKAARVKKLQVLASEAEALLEDLNRRQCGPELLRREMAFSVSQLTHLGRRLAWMLAVKQGKGRRADGMALLEDLKDLESQFLSLWKARNRPGQGTEWTLKLYGQARTFYQELLKRCRD